jgi:hypothetical protein
LLINWQDWSYIALLVAIADRRRSGVVRVATVVVITVPVAMPTGVVAVMVINAAVHRSGRRFPSHPDCAARSM